MEGWAKMIGGGGVQKSYNGIEPIYHFKLDSKLGQAIKENTRHTPCHLSRRRGIMANVG